MSEINTNPAPIVQEALPAGEVEVTETESTEEGSESDQSVEQTAEEAKLAALQSKDTSQMNKTEKKAHEKRIEKFKLKVDGREEDFEIDLNDHEQVKNHLQKSRASSKRMEESANLRKSAEQFIELLKTNPRKVLSDPNIGVDLKNLAQEIINDQLEQAAKSPEQIEKEQLQKELQEIKDKYKKDEDDRKDRDFKRLQAEQEEKIQNNIESALKDGGLPKSPYTVRKMAELMMLALENGKNLEPKDLVPMLKNQMNADFKDFFSASNDDVLEELLGKERISSMQKRRIAKVKATQPTAQTASSVKPTGTTKPMETKTPGISMRDFLKGKGK